MSGMSRGAGCTIRHLAKDIRASTVSWCLEPLHPSRSNAAPGFWYLPQVHGTPGPCSTVSLPRDPATTTLVSKRGRNERFAL